MPDRYAVIGNPVAHSKSPWIHAEFARACAQELEYVRIEAPLDAFAATADIFCAAGGLGANVTLPFKQEAFRYCATVSVRASEAQAVNTLVFDHGAPWGDNTDGVGLVRDLKVNLGFELRGRRVLVMGAGGAARGVFPSLRAQSPQRLVVANRTPEKARALAARFEGTTGCGYAELAPAQFDLVVNATSAGLAGELPPLPPLGLLLAPGALVYDMVYGRDTPLL
ncbi:MAG: shikimate dehydrogenase, partial [Burkholderiales bacterium]